MTENTANTFEELGVSARLDEVSEPPPPMPEEPADLDPDQREAIAQRVRQAKDAGIALTGPGGLLKALTAQIVEAALDEELNEHLGYEKHDPIGRGTASEANTPPEAGTNTSNGPYSSPLSQPSTTPTPAPTTTGNAPLGRNTTPRSSA